MNSSEKHRKNVSKENAAKERRKRNTLNQPQANLSPTSNQSQRNVKKILVNL
jgi:hypothetical protein